MFSLQQTLARGKIFIIQFRYFGTFWPNHEQKFIFVQKLTKIIFDHTYDLSSLNIYTIHILVLNQQILKQSGHLFKTTDCRIIKFNATHLQQEILVCNVRGISL